MKIRASSRITCECGWTTGWSKSRSIHADRDPNEQFDLRADLLASIDAWTNAASGDVRSHHVVGDAPSIVGMVDSFGRPATVFTPPEDLRRDPARWPTPAEFVTEWERYTPEQRLQLAERVIADGQKVAAAALLTHRLEVAMADRDALRAEVERLNESTGEVWREMNEHINDATDRAEAAEAALARIEELAKVQAISCRAMHRADDERNWLDVLAIIERAALRGAS